MSKTAKKISSSLALATAAFLSMPQTTKAQEFSPCSALRSGRVPARVRIEGKGPWPLRTDKEGFPEDAHITTNMWNPRDVMGVRVGAEVVDVRVGVRIDCMETKLRSGEGVQLRMDLDPKDFAYTKETPLLGIRIIVLRDPSSQVKKKIALPRISGTVQSNVLYNNENITIW